MMQPDHFMRLLYALPESKRVIPASWNAKQYGDEVVVVFLTPQGNRGELREPLAGFPSKTLVAQLTMVLA